MAARPRFTWGRPTGLSGCRANIGRADVMPDKLLHLPADTEQVFASHAEFLAFHKGISLEAAEEELKDYTPDRLMALQFRIAAEKARAGKAFVERV